LSLWPWIRIKESLSSLLYNLLSFPLFLTNNVKSSVPKSCENIKKSNNFKNKRQGRKISRMVINKSSKVSNINYPIIVMDDEPEEKERLAHHTEARPIPNSKNEPIDTKNKLEKENHMHNLRMEYLFKKLNTIA
jgi:hypothetical protein